jgi:AcrR family transcriptional regulator
LTGKQKFDNLPFDYSTVLVESEEEKMPRRKDEDLKEDILHSARKLFGQFGPKKTTVDEIAAEAGVGKGTVYYYFEDKQDIFLKVVQEESEELIRRLKSAVNEYETPDMKLRALFVEKVKVLAELVNLRWLELSSESGRWSGLAEQGNNLNLKEQEMLEEIIEDGQARGFFKTKDVKKVAGSLHNMFEALAKTLPEDLGAKELKSRIEDMLMLLLEGLRSRELKPLGSRG